MNSESLTISVVTAVFNRASTIGQALRSVQAQRDVPVEHVIQDGGSTDGTLDVICRHRSGATRLETARDGGIYDAINRGIGRATGDIVGLMHSDDFFAHDRVLHRVAEAFDAQDVDGVYGDLDYVSATDPRRVVRHWKSGSYDRAKLARGWMPPHPTLYLRREVFEAWGGYDTRFRISADYDAMLRWLSRGNIRLAYVPEVLVKMRVGGASNGSLGRILRKSREDLEALRRNQVGGLGALALKNAQKLSQFVVRERGMQP